MSSSRARIPPATVPPAQRAAMASSSSSSRQFQPSLPLLRLLCKRIASLGDFIGALLGGQAVEKESDPESFRDLLRQTVIGLSADYEKPSKGWTVCEEAQEAAGVAQVKEVVDSALLAIFEAAAPAQPSNQLTMGFTSSDWSYQTAVKEKPLFNPARPSIYAKHINTSHTVFSMPAWRTLLSRVGSGPLVHLLSRTSIFVPLENGCLLQIAGMPVVDPKTPKRGSAIKRKAAATASPTEDDPTTSKRHRKGRNAQRRKRKSTDGQAPSTEDLNAMDWEESGAPPVSSPGFTDADIDAELNPHLFRPIKRPKIRPAPPTPATPADISLPRNRIFYAKPMVRRARLPSQKRIVCGLPEEHILNLGSSSVKTPPGEPPASPPHPLALLMFIFPRQFGLKNIFTTPSFSSSNVNYGDQGRRAEEIAGRRAAGTLKIDKKSRMRNPGLQALMKELRSNWQKEDVWKLRSMHCPSKIPPIAESSSTRRGQPLPDPVALPIEFVSHVPANENISTATSNGANEMTDSLVTDINTQRDPSVVHYSQHLAHGDEESKIASTKAHNFIQFTQPASQSVRFVLSVTKRVVPLALFGSENNRNIVCKSIERFLTLRRHESFTLHSVLVGFRTTDCAWLAPAGIKLEARVTPGDSQKRTELLQEFLWWLFDGFLIPLIKTNFYVTESAAYKKEVLFFRQDDWEVLCRPVLKQLQSTVYKALPDFDINKAVDGSLRQLGHSQVRLLPKETGVRPIINLRRKPQPDPGAPFVKDGLKSINGKLAETFSVLESHRTAEPSIFGSSILGADEIYPRLKAFRQAASLPDGSLPRLYFVKVDVRSCFDTIEQCTLMDVLADLLQDDDDYDIVRYNKAKLVAGQLKKRFLNESFPAGTTPSFPELARSLAADRSREVLMDKAFDSSVSRDQVIALLREHIQSNTIKIGASFYRQAKGIPQGSVVSTFLCSLFYADMERKHLTFTNSPDCMLARLVDDFLLVTTDKSKATHFVRTMHAGHPKYGCYVAPEKTLLSGFECAILHQDTPKVLLGDLFPWCGRLINTRNLSMSGDYTRDSGSVKKTLTVDGRRNPGFQLRSKILRNIALKCSIAFNDTTLNSRSTVYLNIYQNVAHGAMKTVHLCDSLDFDSGLHGAFLLRIINEVGDFLFSTTVNSSKSRTARSLGAEVSIQKDVVCWLSRHAFHKVLSTKQTRFLPIVKRLQTSLDPNPCLDGGPAEWEQVLEGAWKGLSKVVY